MKNSPPIFEIAPSHLALFHELKLDGDSIFTDPRIHVWRSLPDRENATLDFQGETPGRLHIKRYPPSHGFMAEQEMRGYGLLGEAGIPAAPIIAHGFRSDGSSFIILEDLSGYTPADKLLEKGFPFDQLLHATADLAALLHSSGLHHRDLYLCHFMVKPQDQSVDAKLIDMARVDRLKSVLTRKRWIIKDLAQFWFSTKSLPITDQQRANWLQRYCQQRQVPFEKLIGPVRRKANAIGRHDVKLRQQQPGRNVSVAERSTLR